MERTAFEERLRTAARGAVQFAREFVRQSLPDESVLRVVPNCSDDSNPLVGDEQVFPGESLPDGQGHGPWAVAEAVAFLWRAGKVPVWIDLSAVALDGDRTLVELRCCGRFTGSEESMYHQHRELAPFHVTSPALPPDWRGKEESERFDLYWALRVEDEPRAAPDPARHIGSWDFTSRSGGPDR